VRGTCFSGYPPVTRSIRSRSTIGAQRTTARVHRVFHVPCSMRSCFRARFSLATHWNRNPVPRGPQGHQCVCVSFSYLPISLSLSLSLNYYSPRTYHHQKRREQLPIIRHALYTIDRRSPFALRSVASLRTYYVAAARACSVYTYVDTCFVSCNWMNRGCLINLRF
jgi:hypothetical protein